MIVSPCIKVCTLDAASRLCTGCGRTLEEIAGWGSMSDRERERIMRALPARLAQGFGASKSDGTTSTMSS